MPHLRFILSVVQLWLHFIESYFFNEKSTPDEQGKWDQKGVLSTQHEQGKRTQKDVG